MHPSLSITTNVSMFLVCAKDYRIFFFIVPSLWKYNLCSSEFAEFKPFGFLDKETLVSPG
jgi:hypothetical protein